MPVAVLLSTWALGVAPPNFKTLFNVSFIVIGVIIASIGEIKFNWTGFIYQLGGIVFEAIRLTLVQSLLSSAEYKMDPLVSLYYFAPVCAIMNSIASLVLEVPKLTIQDIYNVGVFVLILNAFVAFMLNVSVVFLVSLPFNSPSLLAPLITSKPSLLDRENLLPRPYPLRYPQRHTPCRSLNAHLGHPRLRSSILWL